jgi:hypothetical protein
LARRRNARGLDAAVIATTGPGRSRHEHEPSSQDRVALITLAALVSPITAASAHAAAWQSPLQISQPMVNTGDAPRISLGVSGDAAAAWYESGVDLLVVARKRAGGAWSAPATLAAGGTGTAPLARVSVRAKKS